MKYLLIFLISTPAFACNGSISQLDFAKLKAKTPNSSVSIDCSGVGCLCIPDGEFVNSETSAYMTVDLVNKTLSIDAVAKAALLAQYKAALDAKTPSNVALNALKAKITAGTITAQEVVQFIKLKEGL